MRAAYFNRTVSTAASVFALILLIAIPVSFAGGNQRKAFYIASVTPSAGQTISGQVPWQVTTSGEVNHVDFIVDGEKQWTEMTAPYMFNGDPNGRLDTRNLANGAHDLEAIVYDSRGHVTSALSRVNVANGAPSVAGTPTPTPTPPPPAGTALQAAIDDPAQGETVSGHIAWIASATGGVPAKITFAIDGSTRWTEYTSPYYFNGDPNGTLDTATLSNGVHTLTATAYDGDGGTSTASVSVTVANGGSPTPVQTFGPPSTVIAPTVSGTPRVGNTLTASAGTWTGTAPITSGLAWQRCASGACSAIAAATGNAYTVTSADVGASLRVLVTATNTAGSVSAASGQTAAVTAPAPAPLPVQTGGSLYWSGDFETGDLTQWPGLAREGGPGSVSIVTAPVAQGSYAAKFVTPPYTGGLSRIEVDEGGDAATGAGAITYGSHTIIDYSLMVDPSTQFGAPYQVNGYGGRFDMAQWHPFYDPCWGGGLRVYDDQVMTIQFRGGAMTDANAGCSYASDKTWTLGVVPKGTWLNFHMDVVWSGDPSVGRVQVWLNGKEIVPLTHMATMSSEGGGRNFRLRQGIYRTSPFNGTTVLYADGMKVYKLP